MASVPMKKWLSVEEAAEYLGLKKSTIYAYSSQRRLPYYKRGNLVRFLIEDLDKWLQEARVPTEAESIQEQLNKER